MVGSGVGARVRDPPVLPWPTRWARRETRPRRTASNCVHSPRSSSTRASAAPAPAGPWPVTNLRIDAISEAEIERALDDPDPPRGLAPPHRALRRHARARPVGVTRIKALGTQRIARTLRDAVHGGREALRSAVREFMRPMLSPALAVLSDAGGPLLERRDRRPLPLFSGALGIGASVGMLVARLERTRRTQLGMP